MYPSKKVYRSLEDVASFCVSERRGGSPIILTSGCFDLVHGGHVDYVFRAAQFGFLVLGVNSDAFVRRLKGEGRPIRGEDDRALIMASMYAVGMVVIFDDDCALIEAVRPDVYVASPTSHVRIGEDAQRLSVLEKIGAEIKELESNRPDISTTKMLQKCCTI